MHIVHCTGSVSSYRKIDNTCEKKKWEKCWSKDQEGALKSISFNVSSCLGCPGAPVEGGLKVFSHLFTFSESFSKVIIPYNSVINYLFIMQSQVLLRGGGRQCETVAGLDHKDTMEYVSGQQVYFQSLTSPLSQNHRDKNVDARNIDRLNLEQSHNCRWYLTGSQTRGWVMASLVATGYFFT